MTTSRLYTQNLGHSQKLVLRLLANGPKSASMLAYDWPSLSESAARSAIERLGRRSLVDVAGWEPHRRGRTYRLTSNGAEAVRLLDLDPVDEDDE